MLYRNAGSKSWINSWVSGPVYWVGLGCSFSSQQSAWCCGLDYWPEQCWLIQQCLTCCWAVLAQGQGLFLTLPPQQSRLGLGKRVWGHTARTADLNRLKKYSIPYNVILSNKTGVCLCGSKVAVVWRLAAHWSAGGKWWVIAFASLGILFFFFNYLDTFILPVLSPILLGVLSKQQNRGLSCQPGSTHHNAAGFLSSSFCLGHAFLMQKVLGLLCQAKATCKPPSCFWPLGQWTQATEKLNKQF